MSANFDMPNIIKVFSTASRVVFNEMTQSQVPTDCKYEKHQSYKSREYSLLIGVTGKYEGSVTMF